MPPTTVVGVVPVEPGTVVGVVPGNVVFVESGVVDVFAPPTRSPKSSEKPGKSFAIAPLTESEITERESYEARILRTKTCFAAASSGRTYNGRT